MAVPPRLRFDRHELAGAFGDVASDRAALWVALLVAVAAVGLPNGYVVGLVGGTAIAYAAKRGWVRIRGQSPP